MRFEMRKILFLFSLYSMPIFGVVNVPSGCPNCICQADDDLDVGACWGDCQCVMQFDPGPSPRFFPIVFCVCLGEQNAILLNQQLIYSGIDTNLFQVAINGFFGPPEGTYPDYQKIYFIDSNTPLTNEIEIHPSWCK